MITDENYNDYKAVNNTALSYLKRGSGHYWAFLEGKSKQTQAMRFGIALHEGILEPHKFDERAVIKLENKGAGIRAKIQKQVQDCEAEKKLLLSASEFEVLKGISKVLHEDNFVINLLEKAKIEFPLAWDYKDFHCKGRLDGIVQSKAIFDFKFVADATPHIFMHKAKYYGYHRQAFWYKTGALSHGLIDYHSPYYIIAVEKVYPFAYSVIEVTESILQEGKKEADYLLENLKKVQEENNKSPFYENKIVEWKTENAQFEEVELDFGHL
jgi:hypothetical protein